MSDPISFGNTCNDLNTYMGPYKFPSSFHDWISCRSPFRLVILEIIYTPIRGFADLLHFFFFFYLFDEFASNSAQVTDI